jgi:soluble lytic murein transglycosylase-like protein
MASGLSTSTWHSWGQGSMGCLLRWRCAVPATCLAFFMLVPQPAIADCFDEAGAYHSVNPWVMRAIVFRESRFNPRTVASNKNNTSDFGLSGINSVHLPELATYGISRDDLFDPCKAIYVGAWRLRKMIKKYGNNWQAVGAYHSETVEKRDAYASIVRAILSEWARTGVMPAPPVADTVPP